MAVDNLFLPGLLSEIAAAGAPADVPVPEEVDPIAALWQRVFESQDKRAVKEEEFKNKSFKEKLQIGPFKKKGANMAFNIIGALTKGLQGMRSVSPESGLAMPKEGAFPAIQRRVMEELAEQTKDIDRQTAQLAQMAKIKTPELLRLDQEQRKQDQTQRDAAFASGMGEAARTAPIGDVVQHNEDFIAAQLAEEEERKRLQEERAKQIQADARTRAAEKTLLKTGGDLSGVDDKAIADAGFKTRTAAQRWVNDQKELARLTALGKTQLANIRAEDQPPPKKGEDPEYDSIVQQVVDKGRMSEAEARTQTKDDLRRINAEKSPKADDPADLTPTQKRKAVAAELEMRRDARQDDPVLALDPPDEILLWLEDEVIRAVQGGVQPDEAGAWRYLRSIYPKSFAALDEAGLLAE